MVRSSFSSHANFVNAQTACKLDGNSNTNPNIQVNKRSIHQSLTSKYHNTKQINVTHPH